MKTAGKLMRLIFLGIFITSTTISLAVEDLEQQAEEKRGLGLIITGNQELPKSLIIVPWKNPESGKLIGRDFRSLTEEQENLLDRDVYLRELSYERVNSSAEIK